MSLSRSLNFSIFQTSNSSVTKKEEIVEPDEPDYDEDEDYDWGKRHLPSYLSFLTSVMIKDVFSPRH